MTRSSNGPRPSEMTEVDRSPSFLGKPCPTSLVFTPSELVNTPQEIMSLYFVWLLLAWHVCLLHCGTSVWLETIAISRRDWRLETLTRWLSVCRVLICHSPVIKTREGTEKERQVAGLLRQVANHLQGYEKHSTNSVRHRGNFEEARLL